MGVLTEPGCIKLTLSEKREASNLLMAKIRMKKLHIPEQNPEEIIQHVVDEYGDSLNIGWSGGKCSTVVLKMVIKYFPKVPVTWCNTLVLYKEDEDFVQKIAKMWDLNLITLYPWQDFWTTKKEHGWPKLRKTGSQLKAMGLTGEAAQEYRRPYCCLYTKELPEEEYYINNNIHANFSGLRAAESMRRAVNLIGGLGQCYTLKSGKFKGMVKAHPIALWTQKQVNDFLAKNNVPENLVYRSQNRNGCKWCTAFKGCKEAMIRYSLWKFGDWRMYDFVINDMYGTHYKHPVMTSYRGERN
jgi:3'-phosphoadenosine 5'-phosphosulfate sulfotransferase (PAPS reductase)/FAD synthetase